jgi:hypothetical protein
VRCRNKHKKATADAEAERLRNGWSKLTAGERAEDTGRRRLTKITDARSLEWRTKVALAWNLISPEHVAMLNRQCGTFRRELKKWHAV